MTDLNKALCKGLLALVTLSKWTYKLKLESPSLMLSVSFETLF